MDNRCAWACLLACVAATMARGEEPAAGGALHKSVARPEAFKTLVNPNCSHCVDESKRRAGELRDDDRVLAWIRGKYDGGAVPLRFFLVPYRVISDTYGVFVYDPDAGFVRGYEPSLDFTFYGWRDGVMVIRHKDGTLFSSLSGRAFDGPRKGQRLKPIATIETNWGHWLAGYPGAVAYHMFEKYQPVELPKQENKESLATRLPWGPSAVDPNLPVVGVEAGDAAAAYSLEWLEKSGGVVAGAVGGQPVVVLWYAPTRSAAAYAPEVEGSSPPQLVTLSKDSKVASAPFVDRETGSHWDIAGRAVDGPLKGKTLRWVPSVQCRWFAWKAEFPSAALQMSPKRPARTSAAPPSAEPRHGKVRRELVTEPVGAPVDKPANANEVEKSTARVPVRGAIVAAAAVTDSSAAEWARQGFRFVVVTLDDLAAADATAQRRIARSVAAASLELYYWIEVARNPRMADAHPEWMASLGVHDDWHEQFPSARFPQRPGEVAKAWPWVPIGYRETFAAHLARIARLLETADPSYRGLLLNDLQGGPASCGCGNLLCRWAIDYHVPSTATKTEGGDVAERFVSEVKKLVPGKSVIPVWTTECEDVDLPMALAPGGRTTGRCGNVPCANGTCPKAFAQQWSALLDGHDGAVGLLALDGELGGRQPPSRVADDRLTRAVKYLDAVPKAHQVDTLSHDRLWLVVQGYDVSPEDSAAVLKRAGESGAARVLVAKTRLDQSYQPRIVTVKQR
jgi:Protein of unknown function (DUF3179)